MHRPGDVDEVGQDAYIEHYCHFHRTFPDFQATIKDVLADDDRIGLRVALRGTHEDELLDRAPTGTSVAFSAQIIYRLSNAGSPKSGTRATDSDSSDSSVRVER